MKLFNQQTATLIALSALSVAGCSTQSGSESHDRALLAQPVANARIMNSPGAAEIRGETATAYGDDQTAVKLFERSVQQQPSIVNEFNLAAAYSRTRRPNEAIFFYRKVAGAPATQMGVTETTIRVNGPEKVINFREEAAKRVAVLEASNSTDVPDAKALSVSEAAQADAVRRQNQLGWKERRAIARPAITLGSRSDP